VLEASGADDAQVLGIKIRVDRSWPIIQLRPFDRFAYPIHGEVVLVRALKRLMRLSPAWGTPGPVAIARVVEVLSMWPGFAGVGAAVADGEQPIPDTAALGDELEPSIRAALELIDRRLNNPPDVVELAAVAGLSPRHFARRFRQALGITPHGLIDSRRLTRAKELLLQEDLSVAEIAEMLGFDSLATFSRWFAKHTGTPPSRTRRGAMAI
jgi:AraC-like DNA-binding protein